MEQIDVLFGLREYVYYLIPFEMSLSVLKASCPQVSLVLYGFVIHLSFFYFSHLNISVGLFQRALSEFSVNECVPLFLVELQAG